ncbi:MAG: segregation protein B [Firmicutes bacterium]|nr:segregation protein B [Bacillota bacterium]
MSTPRVRVGRVAVVGATSLHGKELKALLAESVAASEIRLLDEESVGTLTEAAGEAAVVLPAVAENFEGAEFVFFAGRPEFAARHWADARRAGARVIDLSGALAEVESAVPWIPVLDRTLPPPAERKGELYWSPSTPAIVATTLAAALAPFRPARVAVVFFVPVSERGQAGVQELESQTVQLLSFHTIPKDVFAAQVAFNLLGSYGAESPVRLADLRARISHEVARYLAGRATLPAVQLVQAPVFFGYAFTACIAMDAACSAAELEHALARAGLVVRREDEEAPSNINVTGKSQILVRAPEADAAVPNAYWLWGAADNLRLVAANAVSIAERLRTC